ncbi:TPA: hypothetical protein OUA98_004354 [Klebsiella michiganensis]|uniref:hypothetical protein n=1 Tax=Klebsiella michiganensis TaxID=1134687 RepID=UPI001315941D|nr:hypothetical protein [Klebsiella michiganensis]HBM3162289.1 hypothetical protein [Klebsiella michiganensis]HCT8861427.1 hypothetical protein [Klebsiella michiganensis]
MVETATGSVLSTETKSVTLAIAVTSVQINTDNTAVAFYSTNDSGSNYVAFMYSGGNALAEAEEAVKAALTESKT